MAASFLASFLIFIATGVYELFVGKADFLQEQPMIQKFVYAILFLNACYYYYIAAYTEMNPNSVSQLSTATRWEWIIRVINQTALFGLWFLLHFSWGWFSFGLISIYVTYLIWDLVTWTHFSKHFLVFLDFAGLLLAIGFLLLKSKVEDVTIKDHTSTYFFLGIITAAYFAVLVAGVRHCRFNPFAIRFLTRPNIH